MHVQSEFNTVVPSVFSYTELPNTWNYLNGYEAIFLRFAYDEGLLEIEPSGYLFMLFSVRSLMAIPSCSCSSSILEDTRSEDMAISRNDVFEEADTWVTIGFSQKAFNDILRPYAHFVHRYDGKYTLGKDIVSATVSHWMQYHAGELNVLSDRVEVQVSANAGGEVDAYAQDRIFLGGFGYKAAKINVDINKITLKGYIFSRYNTEWRASELSIKPDVVFSDPNVEIEGLLPWPISEIAEMVIKRYGSRALGKIKENINNNMTVILLFPRFNGMPYFNFSFLRADFFADSSVVITGRASDD
ncbi:hypothetical protein [Paenibacillus peoriae]|uniref:hypothetical protein n=1 Tax=Paenibacillus peoriae TaxID=59893 RepID=UPI00215B64C0|nr:hypothetical protein [Paenibacillus peoriae]